jgi:hypothetical protein
MVELQPALFFIDLQAPNVGDTYDVKLTLTLTFLLFLLPLLLLQIIVKLSRRQSIQNIGPERTGVFVSRQKAMQSRLLGVPIFINSEEVGVIDNGRTNFYDVPQGRSILQVGKGKQASDKLEITLSPRDQQHFSFHFLQNGFSLKIELVQIELSS